ncbi:hypothetical protein [Streptomyces fuscigenes]|uniref:hypothetical protein n=1 Tax=Streptomyces fuscigenes TaxID=1528880 RepID=UPI001F192B92|nr:hypothetical protein [Streptomyces fuscigenes]MCF3962266.1 hypothetical protein [Streptomyces fuscigenes]
MTRVHRNNAPAAPRGDRRRLRLGIVTATAALAVSVAVPAHAADNADPGFQVKLLVDPTKTLGAGGTPLATADTAFGLGKASGVEAAEYLDSTSRQLQNQGWSVRVRHDDNDDEVKETYKKRYAIAGDGTDADALDDALDQAADDSFDADEEDYEAQVDLSYNQATLDFSDDKKADAKGLGSGKLPSAADARDDVVDDLPGKLDDLGSKDFAANILAAAHIYGPVVQTNYPGTLAGHTVELQITPMHGAPGGSGYWAEISADAKSLPAAVDLRDDIVDALNSRGWLIPQNAFKTEQILATY